MAHDGIARTGKSQFTCLRHQGGIRLRVTHRKHPGILDVDPANHVRWQIGKLGAQDRNLPLHRCIETAAG
jgi:hypothetical protein